MSKRLELPGCGSRGEEVIFIFLLYLRGNLQGPSIRL